MERVRDVMSGEPIVVDAETPIRHAAEIMHDRDVGDVIVTKAGELYGVLTDRDIVVRAVARGFDLAAPVSDVCTSGHIVTVGPDDPIDKARDRMRKKAVRRIIVVEDDRPVGVV
jgi:CBS domain-containing protein